MLEHSRLVNTRLIFTYFDPNAAIEKHTTECHNYINTKSCRTLVGLTTECRTYNSHMQRNTGKSIPGLSFVAKNLLYESEYIFSLRSAFQI